MTAAASIILETRKTLSDGTHPVKLRLTFNRESRYYTLKIRGEDETPRKGFTPDEWNKITDKAKKTQGSLKHYRKDIDGMQSDANKIIADLKLFSFDAFYKRFFNVQDNDDLLTKLNTKAAGLRKEGKIKTAILYTAVAKSLQRFIKTRKSIPFTNVTAEFLNRYDKWLRGIGSSTTTVSMYMRCVRWAVKDAGMKDDAYPFGRTDKGLYQIPTAENVKKALTIKDIAKIYHYDAPPRSTREYYRDLWLFSYLCNGANIKDLALLKYKDIDGEMITFIRAKTKGKGSKEIKIHVPLTVEIGRLIDRHGQQPATPESYILPILKPAMDPEAQRVAIDNAVRAINKHIKVIAANCGITANVTTYTARHSFATVLKRSGTNISYISEALGHSNLITTQNYLASFEAEEIHKTHKQLTNW